MRYRQGTKSKVMKVEKRTPHAKDTAIGKKGAVEGVVVVIRGMSPTKVVTEVRMIGLNRTIADAVMAASIDSPARRLRLE